MSETTYDIIIIGGGPGGYVAAERAGHLGKSVLLIERADLGGVCLNWGCIPTKSLLNSAKTYRHALEAEQFGVKVGSVEFDLEAAMKWKQKTTETLRGGVAFLMKKNGVTVVNGEANLVDRNTVAVGDARYSGRNIIIASGSRAAMPPIPGADLPHVVTNRGALTITSLPKRVAVVGGGVIGMEFASFFSALDVEVEVIEMLPEILPMMDRKHAAALRKTMSSVKFHLDTRVNSISTDSVSCAKGDNEFQVAADLVLLATGRRPNVEGLDLEALKIDVTRKGISVNEQMQTNIPGIYAIGDVTGMSLLAHSASRMGEVAVHHICGIGDRMRYDAIPWALYTMPEAAGCGLTLDQAKAQSIAAKEVEYLHRANGRNLAENGAGPGSAKLVIDETSGVVVGVHILGAYASENIAAAAVMLETEVRAQELREIVFPHPTVSEVMREPAFDFAYTINKETQNA